MPGYDASLSLVEGGDFEESDNAGPDPFSNWDQGNA